ncbi:hypothetical protein ACVWZM_007878 [Bradyrhizobium sp. USDA 4501]
MAGMGKRPSKALRRNHLSNALDYLNALTSPNYGADDLLNLLPNCYGFVSPR